MFGKKLNRRIKIERYLEWKNRPYFPNKAHGYWLMEMVIGKGCGFVKRYSP